MGRTRAHQLSIFAFVPRAVNDRKPPNINCELEKERDEDTEEVENADQEIEATKGVSLGEVDGESNDGAESHQDGAESDVLRDEREGESRYPC
jgi:hypothetical protein